MSIAFPDLEEVTETFEEVSPALPWKVIVSNDPVNLIPVVIIVFQKVLNISEELATEYTRKVHYEGRCAVFFGSQEECQAKAEILMSYHLWTHVEKGE